MAKILIVGYGNTLRGDDGLGPHVVRQLAQHDLPGVRTRVLVQLTPELAEEVARAEVAIFVDAALAPPHEVAVQVVSESAEESGFTHGAAVGTILSLARTLYGHVPHASLVSVAGSDFELGEGLSYRAEENARLAVEKIIKLVSKVNIACTNSA